MVTGEPAMYYSRPGLAYVLAGEVLEKQLHPYPERLFKNQHIRTVVDPVNEINLKSRKLTLHHAPEISYGKLLVATGALAVKPDTPGIDLDGVVKLDNLADAKNILALTRRARSAVVVGGGITAIEIVEGLVAQGVETYYFLRGDRYWSSVLDEVESRIVERRLAGDGVRIHYHTEMMEVFGNRGRVTGVRFTENGHEHTISCQIVAVAIGIKPRMDLAITAGLRTQRGILVDARLQTSDEHVFAAGDVAQVYDREKGEYLLDSLWNPAIEMGRIAGANMTGANLHYEKKFPMNVTRLAGLVTTIIGRIGRNDYVDGNRPRGDADVHGIMRGDSEVWRLQPNAVVAQTYSGDSRLRLYINGNKIVGAVVMGDQSLSPAIQTLIQKEVDVSSIRDLLLRDRADLHSILSNYWSALSHAAAIT